MGIPNWQKRQQSERLNSISGTTSWIDGQEIIHNPATQLNHIGVARNSRRKVGRSGRALCGEPIIDQDALCNELQSVSNFVPIIDDLTKCKKCKKIVLSWLMSGYDDEENLIILIPKDWLDD